MENINPNFIWGVLIGFMIGASMFSFIVTVSWIWYGERICKKCKKSEYED